MTNATEQSNCVSYFVLDEHTLGYVNDRQPNSFGILGADVHGRNWINGPVVLTHSDRLRPATQADFDTFRVDATGHLKDVAVTSPQSNSEPIPADLQLEYDRLANRWRVGAATPAEIARLRELSGPDSLLGMILDEDA